MSDALIIGHGELLRGITPYRADLSENPLLVDLLDFRVRESGLERLGIVPTATASITGNLEEAFLKVVDYGGMPSLRAMSQVQGYCWLGKNCYLLQHAAHPGKILCIGGPVLQQNLPGGVLDGFNGSIVLKNFPGPGAILINRPGMMFDDPIIEPLPAECIGNYPYSQAIPRGSLPIEVRWTHTIQAVHPFREGLLVFSDEGITYLSMQPFAQQLVSEMGLLSKRAWAGSVSQAFFIGKDKVLYALSKEGLQPLGYSWLFSQANAAWLSFIPETGDLVIMLRVGTEYTSYLYNKGLSRLSVPIFDLCLHNGGLFALTATGDTVAISLPDSPVGYYNWALHQKATSTPNREPDLVTNASDYGLGLNKQLSGIEVVTSPVWPAYVNSISSNFGLRDGLDMGEISSFQPVLPMNLNGSRFLHRIWLPSFAEAGAFSVKAVRTHILSTDLRGRYAVQSPSR